jgi:hypothetical protein
MREITDNEANYVSGGDAVGDGLAMIGTAIATGGTYAGNVAVQVFGGIVGTAGAAWNFQNNIMTYCPESPYATPNGYVGVGDADTCPAGASSRADGDGSNGFDYNGGYGGSTFSLGDLPGGSDAYGKYEGNSR